MIKIDILKKFNFFTHLFSKDAKMFGLIPQVLLDILKKFSFFHTFIF
jgi:hypothetical protein